MKLNVFVTLPGLADGKIQTVRAGLLEFGDILPGGRHQTVFTYAGNWLKHPGFFPLDPESMSPRVGPAQFKATGLSVPLSVFHDSLPDDWGRKVMIATHSLVGVEQENPNLLKHMGATSMGALSFFAPGKPVAPKLPGDQDILHIDALIDGARRFELGESVDEHMRRLLEYCGTPGGARPKALVTGHDRHWLAKFRSRKDDGLDVVGLEAVCMQLAGKAGLNPAHTEILPTQAGKVLMVERFDISPAGGRHHMISLKTLCKESPGLYANSYRELVAKIRLHSADPTEDELRFFRQMVFNAVIGNTDDHLKNFLMTQEVNGLRLSKAFDLLPDIGGRIEHQLCFAHERHTNGAELVDIGNSWGVPSPGEIVTSVCEACMEFTALARKLDVETESIDRFAPGIQKRAADFADEAGRKQHNRGGQNRKRANSQKLHRTR